jgi:hypothetical protein
VADRDIFQASQTTGEIISMLTNNRVSRIGPAGVKYLLKMTLLNNIAKLQTLKFLIEIGSRQTPTSLSGHRMEKLRVAVITM